MKRINLKQRSLKKKLKELKQKRLKVEESKGITLIALVITIIVLLILAGVSIATLTGENGILTKANEAKIKTEKAGTYEQVEVQVAGSFDSNGEIDIEDLNKNLRNNISGIIYNGNELSEENKIKNLPARLTVDGYEITIDIDGRVILVEDILTADSITSLDYGAYVNYEIDINGDEDTTKDWRIFYVKDYKGEDNATEGNQPTTGKRIFLISSDYVGNTCEALKGNDGAINKRKMIQGTGIYDGTNLEKDCCYYWQSGGAPEYNCILPSGEKACTFPSLFEFTKYSIKDHASGSLVYNNSKCVASLLCTGNWSKFVTKGGEYAIGGPTLEMWIDSWNAKEKGASNFQTLYAVPGTDSQDKGYYVKIGESKKSTSGDLSNVGSAKEKTGYYDTLYFPHRTTDAGDLDKDETNEYEYAYWLASPSAYNNNADALMMAQFEGKLHYCGYNVGLIRHSPNNLLKL